MTQPITQRSFVKGVDASTSKLDQPKGSVPRISNLLFTRRGSLLTVDGSSALITPTNKFNPTANNGSIVAIQQYLTGTSTAPGSSVPSGSFITAGSGIDQSLGGETWTAPNNIATTTYFAGCSLFGNGDFSDYLIANNFRFNIPSGATINSVTVQINRDYTHNSGTVRDSIISLVKAGVVTGVNKSAGALWPLNTPAVAAFTWNVPADITLSPADINLPTYGVAFQVISTGNIDTSFQNANAGQVQMSITYTGAGGVVQVQTGQTLFYLQDSNPGTQLGEVTGLTAIGVNTAGGTLTPGNTYTYGVNVLDGQQNASAGVTTSIVLGGGFNAVQLTWNCVLGAGSYLIKGDTGVIVNSTPNIGQVFQPDFSQNNSGMIGAPTATFTDKNGATAQLTNYPYGLIVWGINNTIGPLRLFTTSAVNVGTGNYLDPVLLAQFPCRANDSNIPNIPPVDASGGVIGGSGQVPQLIQFASLIIIALGNGLRPQSTDGITVSPFTNTFTALYITWAAATTYLVGDLVIPAIPNGHFYKCTQGGLSQTPGPPAFSTTSGVVTIDGQVSWVEAGLVTNSPAPRGAAHVAYHAGSLWWLNSAPVNSSDLQDGPSLIGMSDTGNVKSFNPINRAFIGKDDGSEGTGLASFTIAEFGIAPLGSLIAFKDFTTYQIVGVFGAQDFNIQQLQTNMGCKAPRSIKYVSGFGIIRLSHLGFALCDGVRDKLISEQIRPYIFGNPYNNASPVFSTPGLSFINPIDINHAYLVKADEIVNPPLYIAAAPLQGNINLSRLFIYDLVLKAWTIIDLPSTLNPTSFISSLYQVRTPGYEPVTIVGGFDNGSLQTIQNGSGLWNLSTIPTTVNWAFTSPEIFNTGDPSAEIYVDNILIRGTNYDGNPIKVTIIANNEVMAIPNVGHAVGGLALGTGADTRIYNTGAGGFQIMVGVNEQATSFNSIISGTGRVEIESITWNSQGKASGIPAIIT